MISGRILAGRGLHYASPARNGNTIIISDRFSKDSTDARSHDEERLPSAGKARVSLKNCQGVPGNPYNLCRTSGQTDCGGGGGGDGGDGGGGGGGGGGGSKVGSSSSSSGRDLINVHIQL